MKGATVERETVIDLHSPMPCTSMSKAVCRSLLMVALFLQLPKASSAQRQTAAASAAQAVDVFVRRCDMKNPGVKGLLANGLSDKPVLTWRGHTLLGLVSFDADGGSVARMFFQDLLPADEEELVALWYPTAAAAKENTGSSGINFVTRRFRLSQRESATMKVVRLVYEDPQSGKPVDAPERQAYPDAPKSAKWFIECSVSF